MGQTRSECRRRRHGRERRTRALREHHGLTERVRAGSLGHHWVSRGAVAESVRLLMLRLLSGSIWLEETRGLRLQEGTLLRHLLCHEPRPLRLHRLAVLRLNKAGTLWHHPSIWLLRPRVVAERLRLTGETRHLRHHRRLSERVDHGLLLHHRHLLAIRICHEAVQSKSNQYQTDRGYSPSNIRVGGRLLALFILDAVKEVLYRLVDSLLRGWRLRRCRSVLWFRDGCAGLNSRLGALGFGYFGDGRYISDCAVLMRK